MGGSEVVTTIHDPAFAVDSRGSILAWNPAASDALGYPTSEAHGRLCWEMLAGLDGFGNRYCGTSCPLREMVLRGEPVHRTHIRFRAADGDRIDFGVFTLSAPGPPHTEPEIVHVLDVDGEPVAAGPPDDGNQASRDEVGLTGRQMQVLRRLQRGLSTAEIAKSLDISVATTRHHIQAVLRKLDVHSRLAAVLRAGHLGLV